MQHSEEHEQVDQVLNVNPIGHALLPILRSFKEVDAKLYGRIGTALFRAYEAGLKGGLSDFLTTPKEVTP